MRSEPKLLHIVGDSQFGGASRIILSLCCMAKSLGWHVDVLTTNKIMQETLARHGIGIVEMDVIRRDINPLRDLTGLARLYSFLRSSDYSVVHTHTSKGGFIGRLAAYHAGIAGIIHTVHGFAFHESTPVWLVRLGCALERMAAHWCHKLVFVSHYHRDWAFELNLASPDKIIAIPNGINAGPASNGGSQLRDSLGIMDNEVVFLSTSRLAPEKGLEELIQAAAMLKDSFAVPLRVMIAGDGPFRHKLEKLVSSLNMSNEVIFLGFHREINTCLAAADIVVLASLREGLSIALLEAMAACKPIITTSIGSNREVTKEGEAALLVAPSDSDELAGAMLELASNEPLRTRLSQKAHAIFHAFYTEERMQMMYRDMYFNLLNERDYVSSQTPLSLKH